MLLCVATRNYFDSPCWS